MKYKILVQRTGKVGLYFSLPSSLVLNTDVQKVIIPLIL